MLMLFFYTCMSRSDLTNMERGWEDRPAVAARIASIKELPKAEDVRRAVEGWYDQLQDHSRIPGREGDEAVFLMAEIGPLL